MSEGFAGRWVVLSGASSGIGKAIAMALSRQGARLVLLGRDEGRLQETAGQLQNDSRTLVMDLACVDDIQPLLLPLLKEIGADIYGFCHSAGVIDLRPLNASKPQLVLDQMQVNLVAGLELARTISRRDVMAQNGSLLFISSVSSHVGAPGQTAYCASKGAVAAAARAMAVELAPRNIRVNTLSPGFVKTEMSEKHSRLSQAQQESIVARHPLGMGTVDDVARAALFLLAPENTWITKRNKKKN